MKTEMAPGWLERMEQAQKQTHVDIDGTLYQRLRYGPDHPHMTVKPRCRDCAVALGELHVPGCCVERCARCRTGQAISCGCGDTDPQMEVLH